MSFDQHIERIERIEAEPAGEVTVRFHPQAWSNDQAIPVDPEGPTCWEATPEYVADLLVQLGVRVLEDSTHESDRLRLDPAAPEWVKEWHGPYYCEVLALDR